MTQVQCEIQACVYRGPDGYCTRDHIVCDEDGCVDREEVVGS